MNFSRTTLSQVTSESEPSKKSLGWNCCGKPKTKEIVIDAPKIETEPLNANVDIKTPDLDIKTPDVDIKTPDVDIKTPDVDIKTPDVDIKTPDVDIKTPDVDIKTPGVDIKTPDVDIKTPDVDIKTPEVDIKTPDVDMKTPDGEIKAPLLEGKNLEPELPGGKSSWTGGDCFSCCGNGRMRPQATVQAKPLKPRTEGKLKELLRN